MHRVLYLLSVPTLIVILYLLGSLLGKITTASKSFLQKELSGLLLLICSFEIVALPFMILKTYFSLLFYTYLVVLLCLLLISVFMCRVEIYTDIKAIPDRLKSIRPSEWIALAFVFLQVVAVTLLQHMDDDDGFYVTIASTAVQQNTIFQFEQSRGFIDVALSNSYVTTSIELMYAFFSKLFFLEPAAFIHTVIPVIWIPLAYAAYLQIGDYLLGKEKRVYFLLFLCVINVFGYFSVYTSSSFLLLRVWQGKALMVSVLLPILYYLFLKITQEPSNKSNYIQLTMALLAGIACTNTAYVLLPCALVSVLVPYSLYTRKLAVLRHTLLTLLVPIALFIVDMILVAYQKLPSDPDSTSITISANELFRNFFGNGHYFVLYIIAMIYALIKGRNEHKLFAYAVIFMVVTVLNPLFTLALSIEPLRSIFSSMVIVYWRLYWLIPGFVLIAWMCVDMLQSVKRRWQQTLVTVLLLTCLAYSGNFLFTADNFTLAENRYKLPTAVIKITQIVNEDKDIKKPILLLPDELSAKIRQYNTDNRVLISRDSYTASGMKLIGKADLLPQMFALERTLYYDTKELDTGSVRQLLRLFKVNYVITRDEPTVRQMIQDAGGRQLSDVNQYLVYKIIS